MSKLHDKIKGLSSDFFPEIQSIRHHLHQNPELSFEEFETSTFLKQKLESWGLTIDAEWVKTGFSVIIDGKEKGPCIALRADIDALPIQEQNEVPYKSKKDGKMHACGHDVHASCMMGVAKILNETKNEWNGRLVLFFQAGEEKLPGGASLMIQEGILEKYKPQRMFAQHVYPEMEVGHVGFREGMYMASADEIYLTVKGKGGHAALPHKNVDSVVLAANIITQLQQISSRIAPPTVPTVLSFGKIVGMGATNVIPDEVKIEGTLRTMNEEWRSIYHQKIESICKSQAEAFGGDCEVNIMKGYPFLTNNSEVTQKAQEAAVDYLGTDKVHHLDLRMTAEDFAYFSQKVPSCFYRLGVGNEKKGITQSVHHPKFDIDEKALEIGMGLMASIALRQLEELMPI
ncbi:MAG: M20 family metallopeptidase [Vicingaceae bacterium]